MWISGSELYARPRLAASFACNFGSAGDGGSCRPPLLPVVSHRPSSPRSSQGQLAPCAPPGWLVGPRQPKGGGKTDGGPIVTTGRFHGERRTVRNHDDVVQSGRCRYGSALPDRAPRDAHAPSRTSSTSASLRGGLRRGGWKGAVRESGGRSSSVAPFVIAAKLHKLRAAHGEPLRPAAAGEVPRVQGRRRTAQRDTQPLFEPRGAGAPLKRRTPCCPSLSRASHSTLSAVPQWERAAFSGGLGGNRLRLVDRRRHGANQQSAW